MAIQSDIFAAAVLLYEMLTGYLPFTGQNYDELARSIVRDEPPAPETLREGIPKALTQACLKGMRKDPLERYASASEFAKALRKL